MTSGYLYVKRVIFRTMRTMWKQFPVNWLTSGRLALTTQRTKARRGQQNEKNGGLSGGTMWRDFDLIQLSYFNDEHTIEILVSCY